MFSRLQDNYSGADVTISPNLQVSRLKRVAEEWFAGLYLGISIGKGRSVDSFPDDPFRVRVLCLFVKLNWEGLLFLSSISQLYRRSIQQILWFLEKILVY